MSDADDEPPLPTDHDAWGRIVQWDQLNRCTEALIVAAIQDGFNKPGVNQRVIGRMAEHISDRMHSVLRGAVLKKPFPDEGRAIVDKAHGEMLKALFSPKSADGKALRTAFFGVLRKRATDHVRVALTELCHSGETPDDPGDTADPDTELFSVKEQALHVKLILDRIGDERKRKAFELHMAQVPFGGHKGHSIASILGISADTASDWVKEVQAQLAKLVRKP
jgi:DNA-directed RNA polymerase specialized sigma24 family protein